MTGTSGQEPDFETPLAAHEYWMGDGHAVTRNVVVARDEWGPGVTVTRVRLIPTARPEVDAERDALNRVRRNAEERDRIAAQLYGRDGVHGVPHYVYVRLDGMKFSRPYHPTELAYLIT